MSDMRSQTVERLESLAAYLRARRLEVYKLGNSAKGLTTWIETVDAVCAAHRRKRVR